MQVSIETSDLQQQRKEEAVWYPNQIIIQQRIFSKNLLATEKKKSKILMNEPVYLVLSTLEISKIARYKFCYDYLK